MANSPFKLKYPLESRQADVARVRGKYPDRIPVIVEKAEGCDIPDSAKKKYLVPAALTVGEFLCFFRKTIRYPGSEQTIFLFSNNSLLSTDSLMSAAYEEHKDDDGSLYMTYNAENTLT